MVATFESLVGKPGNYQSIWLCTWTLHLGAHVHFSLCAHRVPCSVLEHAGCQMDGPAALLGRPSGQEDLQEGSRAGGTPWSHWKCPGLGSGVHRPGAHQSLYQGLAISVPLSLGGSMSFLPGALREESQVALSFGDRPGHSWPG